MRPAVGRSRTLLAGTMALAALAAGCGRGGDGTPVTPRPAAATLERAARAVFPVLVEGRLSGTAWVFSPEGRAVTCFHVLGARSPRVAVLTPAGDLVEVTVESINPAEDVAVLSLPRRDEGYEALTRADLPEVGEVVYGLGVQHTRMGLAVSGRIASGGGHFEYVRSTHQYPEVAYLEGPAMTHASGSPWIDRSGRVVGMVVGKIQGAVGTGVSYFIPATVLERFLWPGAETTSPTLASAFDPLWEWSADDVARYPLGARGFVVVSSREGGPLAQAGVRDMDLIVGYDGLPALHRNRFLRHLRGRRPGETMRLDVLSPGAKDPRAVDVTVADAASLFP